ncbi:MAG TPA: pyruvate dehydrogenase complex dihydrolipoamide acetyltransferase [Sorangium sp.]|nr:pyruvate dehydrogenase complex dihydrolipoamide acetyltransferase [Sorangium sp.]
MARLIEMPKLSPTMEEGQIASWHAKEGDTVAVDDLLAEVETDKATMEFRSFDRGVLLKILAATGSVVRLGAPVAIIGEAGEDIDDLLAQAAQQDPPAATASPAAATPVVSASAAPASAARANTDATGRIKASPYVRKLARERSIDLRAVAGSGPGGRIIARDLDGAPTTTAPATATTAIPSGRPSLPAVAAAPRIVPLSMMRKTIARRLTEAKQTVPHFYLTIDVNAGPLVALRSQLNTDLKTAPEPVKVSYNDLIIKATAIAITRAPEVNAQFTADALVYHQRVDISVAVAVDDGLVTPVLRDANRKSVMDISLEVRDLAARARSRKLAPAEMMNGTFSISNLGMYGIDRFAAVINPPEGAILAVGGIVAAPLVEGDKVVAGKRLTLTLSCDHRVVDGAVGAAFLAQLRQVLEQPTQILAY